MRSTSAGARGRRDCSMVRINEKMGLKPAGRRKRTHPTEVATPSTLLSSLRCAACGRGWLVEFVERGGRVRRICGFCSVVQA